MNDICAHKQAPGLSRDPVLATLHKVPVQSSGMNAAIEGMKNLHLLDEYQVACAVAKQLADFAAGYTDGPWDGIFKGIASRIQRSEHVEIPLAAPSSERSEL